MHKKTGNLEMRPAALRAAQWRQVKTSHSTLLPRLAALIFLLAALASRALPADLKPQTISAFDRYVALSEANINSSLNPSPADPVPFIWVDALPLAQRSADLASLRSGKIVIEKLTTLDDGDRKSGV